jgi:hypothetical protein
MSNASKNGSAGRPTGTSNAALAARVDQLEKSMAAFRSLLTEVLTQQAMSQAAPQMLAQMKQQIHSQIESTGLENIANGQMPAAQMPGPPAPVPAQPPIG